MTTIQCRCGAVEIEISAAPIVQFYCHCDDCQAVHGGSFPESVIRRTPSRSSAAIRRIGNSSAIRASPAANVARGCSSMSSDETCGASMDTCSRRMNSGLPFMCSASSRSGLSSTTCRITRACRRGSEGQTRWSGGSGQFGRGHLAAMGTDSRLEAALGFLNVTSRTPVSPTLLREAMGLHANMAPEDRPMFEPRAFQLFEFLKRRGFTGRRHSDLALAINSRLTALARLVQGDHVKGWSAAGSGRGVDPSACRRSSRLRLRNHSASQNPDGTVAFDVSRLHSTAFFKLHKLKGGHETNSGPLNLNSRLRTQCSFQMPTNLSLRLRNPRRLV